MKNVPKLFRRTFAATKYVWKDGVGIGWIR